jgi:hypothetical protein
MSGASMSVAALDLARRGVPVFACYEAVDACSCGENDCGNVGKHPRTSRGFHNASDDLRVIAAWWRRWPRANVALPTGARSGLIVVDVDTKRGADGYATLADLERDLGPLPATRRARTPSGGEHRYFRTGACATIRNAAGRIAGEDAPGVDVRGEGGYVLAPPSSILGAAYQWTDDRPAAELPARWVEALSPPKREAAPAPPWTEPDRRMRTRRAGWCRRALQNAARDLAGTAPGARNDRLWRTAAALGGLAHLGAIDRTDVERALEWACSQWRERSPRKDLDTMRRGFAWGAEHPREVRLEANDDAA